MIRRLLSWDAWSLPAWSRWVLGAAAVATVVVSIVAHLSPLMSALATLVVMVVLAGGMEQAASRGRGTARPPSGRPSQERAGGVSPRRHRMAAHLAAAAAISAAVAGVASFALGAFGEGAVAFFGAVALIWLSWWNRCQSR